ncbi:B-cell lymphoma 3 protein homolog isoform X2 [Sphaeramia orbicularis]|uniref:B-cell lymphoma 3 protein homolog isoform X2 n=1 Tax=Sphaeramia orbicularis TaxID=375764 RepID=UPI00117E11EE|nr:B-cell lymphoma 3 protein homolog isoform X2 [Sphaeramia orbicularis]
MPRIMTMNGDHQSVATAPLDLRTSNRERGSAGSRTPGPTRDTCANSGSPAPPACTETDSLERHSPTVRTAQGSDSGAARRRPADKCVHSSLPFRKRKITVEPEPQTRSPPPPQNPDRFSSGDTDLTSRHRLVSHPRRSPSQSGFGVALVTPRQGEEVRHQSPGGYGHTIRFLPSVYVPVSVPVPVPVPVPEPTHPVVHQTDNLMSSIALATHQDEDGDTALHIAVVQGELAVVRKLIDLLLWAQRGLDIYNNLRQTPLHLAVITQQVNMVEDLLRAGADPAALDRNGQTALHLCCEYNQQDCLSLVLSQSSASTCLETRNYEGLSPLHLAVLRGHKDLARMLLNAGADINAMDIKSGQSPLMHAVESNNVDMVHFLIETGCDVNCQSYSGNTALHSACGRGQVDTVRLLLKSGADSSLKNYHNDTPVMVAKNKKIADVLRGRSSKQIRAQDQHSVSVSPHGSSLTENSSPSPCHSRGCSPSSLPHTPHHSSTSQSPKTPSMLVFPYY